MHSHTQSDFRHSMHTSNVNANANVNSSTTTDECYYSYFGKWKGPYRKYRTWVMWWCCIWTKTIPIIHLVRAKLYYTDFMWQYIMCMWRYAEGASNVESTQSTSHTTVTMCVISGEEQILKLHVYILVWSFLSMYNLFVWHGAFRIAAATGKLNICSTVAAAAVLWCCCFCCCCCPTAFYAMCIIAGFVFGDHDTAPRVMVTNGWTPKTWDSARNTIILKTTPMPLGWACRAVVVVYPSAPLLFSSSSLASDNSSMVPWLVILRM